MKVLEALTLFLITCTVVGVALAEHGRTISETYRGTTEVNIAQLRSDIIVEHSRRWRW